MAEQPLATRLMLTNLPPTLTTPLLRAHINRCPPFPPNLTDLKILLKPDGSSRRIAFIGFKENKEANRVREWVHNTWVQGTGGGANVKVAWAMETKDAPPPRQRTKHVTEEPTPSTSKTPAAGNKDEASRFAEFMSVMGPRKGTALEDISRMPENNVSIFKQQSKASLAKGKEVEKVKEEEEVLNIIEVEKDVVDDEAISDLEYMNRRMKRSLEEVDDEDEDIENEGERITDSGSKEWVQDEDGAPKQKEPGVEANSDDKAKEHAISLILDSSRLFIRNLAFTITEHDLRSLLEPYGEIEQIHIPLDDAKAPKGLAYATFTIAANAVEAYEALDRHSFQGRLLHIMPAIGRNSGEVALKDRKTEGVKGARDELKKKDAGKGLNWGTLYMNSDAVMSSVAARLQISKAELLDPSADNAAVRVALAESHVIAETKQYFEEEGVNLAAFTTSGPRSNTTMLLKNIPYNTSSATLTALFSPFGTISRLLLPPAGTIAIVEMTDAPSASDAWRGLVYKKIGGSVLYLEKAPKELFNGPPVARTTPSTSGSSIASTSKSQSAAVEETPAEAGATLFVKNLNFSTTSTILTNFFSNFPSFVFAKVQTKPDPKIPGGTLSMGFGFVGFKTVQAAMDVKKAREGALLEGHLLEIKFAQRGKESEKEESGRMKGEKRKDNGTSTKLIVKNVPFEVTRKEIRELFSAYGQLKSVRLPKKMDQKTRGFAFLDFASRRDAESAFAALEHTHLLGRHLILQWAEQGEEEVEQLRKRVGNFSNKKIGNKKGKFEMGGDKGDSAMGGDLGGDLE